ncbi:MAG: zinc-dependent peptidase, partial [Pseudomonadales bacterium]
MQWSVGMWGLVPVALVVMAFVFSRWRERRHERRLLDQAFPDPWRQILRERLPVYSALQDQDCSKLEQLIQRFLDDKDYYGCAGLVVTDVMKVCIAAEACLLLLGQSGPVYPRLRSILVYPSGFVAKRDSHQKDGTVVIAEHNLLGESWGNGRVILSW